MRSGHHTVQSGAPPAPVRRRGRLALLVAAGLLAGRLLAADCTGLAAARAALDDQLYDLASEKLTRFLDTAPEPAARLDAILRLAEARHGQRRYQAMLELLIENQAAARASSRAAEFEVWLAMAYFRREQWPEVIETCRRLDAYPDSPFRARAARLRAWALLQQGRRDEALAGFAQAAALADAGPDGPANRLDWAEALLGAGRIQDARAVLEGVPPVSSIPKTRFDLDRLSLLGRIGLADGDHARARAALEPLASSQDIPDDIRAAALIALATVADAESNRVEAVRVLDEGLSRLTEPVSQQLCRMHKGRLLLRLGRVDEGIALVRGFVAANPSHPAAPSIQLDLAHTLLEQGLYDKALLDFQNYLETFDDPAGTALALQGKGTALFHLGRHAESAAAFQRASERTDDPRERVHALLNEGAAQVAAGQYKLAIESYERAAALWPDSPAAEQAEFHIADCIARLGNPDGAERRFWELIDRDPHAALAPRALLRLAEIERRRGRADRARALCAAVSQSYPDPDRAEAWLGLGILDYQAAAYADALARFEQVRGAAPARAVLERAAYLGAWCLFRLGRDADAVTAFQDVARTFPEAPWAPDACFWLGENAYNDRRYGAAEHAWLGLAHQYPASPLADAALFWAGRAALLQREFRRANTHLARLIKTCPDSPRRPDARFYQAAALAELGDFAEAILILDELITQFPEHELTEAAWLRKGDCQFALGPEDPRRYDEAQASYQAALDRPAPGAAARLEAEYKIGRCLEKTGRAADAFGRYMNAVYLCADRPVPGPSATVWFTRAAFQAAALKEAEKAWPQAARIYQHVADADVPASPEARDRINRLRQDHWQSFY